MIYNINIGFLELRLIDFIDILLVSLLLYNIYRLLRGSVAIRIFIGFLILYFFYLIVRASEMELLTNILGQLMGVGVLAVIILFQKEIRRFLLFLGKTNYIKDQKLLDVFSPFFSSQSKNKWNSFITILVDSCQLILQSNSGALIVLSKNSEMKFYSESGEMLNAILSKRLLLSIFNRKSPLHDGAVIIHGEKVIAARCILPVSENKDLPMNFGLRHRAAYGISQDTDALAIVISEEHKIISIFFDGKVKTKLSIVELRSEIIDYLEGEESIK